MAEGSTYIRNSARAENVYLVLEVTSRPPATMARPVTVKGQKGGAFVAILLACITIPIWAIYFGGLLLVTFRLN